MADAVLRSIAIRVHNMEKMLVFYSEAFGIEFSPVDTHGITSQFGDINGVTFKLVPIRDSTNFDDFPCHQPGFVVADVDTVIALAVMHGGQPEGEILRSHGAVHAAVRDPDGNTIELYSA